jgi:uncharacterized protein
MRPVIIVFAKAARPGHVKTRLEPALTSMDAALLHTAFVFDTLESALTLSRIADVELHTDAVTDAWDTLGVPRRMQRDGDLGTRLLHALERALAEGRPRALVVGSDSPDLPPDALRMLLAASADIALGPAEDGGYYAIAATRTAPEMFQGVRWSTGHALADTAGACIAAGLAVAFGPEWYDVDEPAALDRLRHSPSLGRHTRPAIGRIAERGAPG